MKTRNHLALGLAAAAAATQGLDDALRRRPDTEQATVTSNFLCDQAAVKRVARQRDTVQIRELAGYEFTPIVKSAILANGTGRVLLHLADNLCYPQARCQRDAAAPTGHSVRSF